MKTLTCVLNSQVGDQKFLFGCGIFTIVTLEGSVISVGQLMIEQQLLVRTRIVTKLTFKPAKGTIHSQHLYDLTAVSKSR